MDTIKNVFHIDHVAMQFGGMVAVNRLSLDVNEHKAVALIGPNGAGKTTAFSCVAGIYQSIYGLISFNNQVILADAFRGKVRRLYVGNAESIALAPVCKTLDQTTELGITRTFQNIRLSGNLTVFKNVLIIEHMQVKQNVLPAALCLNHVGEKRTRDGSLSLLGMQGLVHLKDETVSSLPYGLQRRLEVIRALAINPSLPLLDESAAGMNSQETQNLTNFIKQVRDDYHLTIFMIEHRMDLVMQVSNRTYVSDFGKLIAQDISGEVRNSSKAIEVYLGVSDDANDQRPEGKLRRDRGGGGNQP